jgi:hypothetical protein
MTPQEILQRYFDGRYNVTGLILAVLCRSGKRFLTETLDILPPDLLIELKRFVHDYRPRMRIFRGPRPKRAAVEFVKEWFVRAARSA